VHVESLPLEKKLELLKKYNPQENYLMGNLVDAQDTVNNWCLSEILEVDNKTVQVHFDGWTSKYDLVRLNQDLHDPVLQGYIS